MGPFSAVAPNPAERREPRPGDELVWPADVVMDRAFTVDASPEQVWPWLEQLGKGRAGWYLPRSVERFVPRRRRALRRLDESFLGLQVGDVVPDYGGAAASFEVVAVDPPRSVVFGSRRGRVRLTWAITLTPLAAGRRTRVALRLRLAPVRRRWLAYSVGELFDAATIAAMAAGLHERLAETKTNTGA